MISVLILTLNEEVNIAPCLESLPWRQDVHVLDSCSTDRTRQIAEAMGARVTVRTFDGYANQRNAGLSLAFANEWVVMLDADERMTADLAKEIELEIANATPDTAMFLVRRQDFLMGRWLKRSSGYPTWFARVMRQGRVAVERQINERYTPRGKSRYLNAHLNHFPFSKGINWWFERHNRYSDYEAQEHVDRGNHEDFRLSDLFASDAVRRRKCLKKIAFWLPGRPWLAFIYLYIVRGGFIDGYPGYRFATMRLAYEIMIDTKVAHLKHEQLNTRKED